MPSASFEGFSRLVFSKQGSRKSNFYRSWFPRKSHEFLQGLAIFQLLTDYSFFKSSKQIEIARLGKIDDQIELQLHLL